MNNHDYSPQEALELLMRKLRERDSELADRVKSVVDQGRDIQEIESSTRGRKKKSRVYRKTAPYTYGEALQVALNALAACFIEQPLFIESCLSNMAKAPLGSPRGFRYAKSGADRSSIGIVPGTQLSEKDVRIELRTETQLSTEIRTSTPIHEMQTLHRFPADQIMAQRENLALLKSLFDFRN